jgi:hypothetical protein
MSVPANPMPRAPFLSENQEARSSRRESAQTSASPNQQLAQAVPQKLLVSYFYTNEMPLKAPRAR